MNDEIKHTFKFKKDSYMKKRGSPVMIIMTCAQCSAYIMSYQKDGPGPLKRCYLDRIHHPEDLAKRQHEPFNKSSSPKLICSSCGETIGTPMIYEKEDRPAYHLRPGFFASKKMK